MNFKKTVSLVLVFAVLFSLAACSGQKKKTELSDLQNKGKESTEAVTDKADDTTSSDEDTSSDSTEDTTEAPAPDTEPAEDGFEVPPYDGGFELGTYEDGKYYNRYLGVGIKMESRWDVLCGEGMMEYNTAFAQLQSLTIDEYKDLLENGEVAAFYDFLAKEYSGNTNNLLFIFAMNTFVDEATLDEYIKDNDDLIAFVKESMISDMEEGLMEAGLTNISEPDYKVTNLNGKDAVIISQTAYLSGYRCSMSYVIKLAGTHLVMVVALSTAGSSTVNSMLGNIYILD
ncbi:MAG: hypothetical protein IJD22_03435 [Clostridia bacterium]|nr:hypothetical protein [Clostridia bacterium]